MNKRVTVVFDGGVLRSDVPLDLAPNTRYVITIQELKETSSSGDAWDVLEEMAGTVDAPEDWSSEHYYYLYGTPKKATPNNQN
ncbi:antitoxin family protein [Nostocaceae cyanobacterium CENA369]|uniref:Antitoxin family protein n=1 Tax=Dendronalium phyllosphericum CENA369 TaxID=1725256 RepID=A0A8J7I590_9NOST|nr:antitoxin family protein [Dendronalium phyllosphericum]MBH8573246.1 antitoxin family protein [Dendronalium phyllosphericum CENA369]